MARKSARDRMSNEINAGAMADIAFLLLIFFLVTTTIVEDRGILVRLPPWAEDEEIEQIADRNVLSILVNAQNQLLVRGEREDISNLRERSKEFIMNPMNLSNMPASPRDAIISLRNDRGTSYETYLEVYNEIMGAYNELRDELAESMFGEKYEDLNIDQRREIRSEIPMIISEAEPTEFGEER